MMKQLIAFLMLCLGASGLPAAQETPEQVFSRWMAHVREVYRKPMLDRLSADERAALSRDPTLDARLLGFALSLQLKHLRRGFPEHETWKLLEERSRKALTDEVTRVARSSGMGDPARDQLQAKVLREFAAAATGWHDEQMARLTAIEQNSAPDFFRLLGGSPVATEVRPPVAVPVAPRVPAGPGIIAFYWPHDTGGLFLVNPDGSGLRRVGMVANIMRGPSISPDRTRLAYVRLVSQQMGGPWLTDVFVCDLNGVERNITNRPGTYQGVQWSPDGQRILAYTAARSDADMGLPTHHWIPLDGGAWQQVASVHPERLFFSGQHVRVSPDGAMLTWVQVDMVALRSRWSIWVAGIDGSNAREVISHGTDQMISYPAISPDGQGIAYARNLNPQGAVEVELCLVPLAGGQPRILVQGLWTILGVAWSPDGQEILMVTSRKGDPEPSRYALHVVRLADRRVRKVETPPVDRAIAGGDWR